MDRILTTLDLVQLGQLIEGQPIAELDRMTLMRFEEYGWVICQDGEWVLTTDAVNLVKHGASAGQSPDP